MANISETSINRPVLSTVMMLVILLFGFIGYRFLGVREFPSVDQPIISVNVSYPGANADVIMNQITEPLEQNINGIPGIRSLSSVSSQGSSRITVEFELSVDMETAGIAHVCYVNKVPFAILRSISDGEGASMDYATFAEKAALQSILVVIDFIQRADELQA